MSSDRRSRTTEILALLLVGVLAVAGIVMTVRAATPTEAERIAQRVLDRLDLPVDELEGVGPGPSSPAQPATPSAAGCTTETVTDDYGLDVVITDCPPGD